MSESTEDAASDGTSDNTESAGESAGESTGAPRPRGRALGWLLGTASVVLAADLISKLIVVATLEGRAPLRLLGGAVYLVLTRNTGAAFSMGQGFTIVFTLIAVLVIVAILRFARRVASTPWAICLGLILGGAAGNLIDRLFRAPGPLRGAVIDFVSVFDDSGGVWPVFNLADSALVIGVAVAVLLSWTGRQLDGSRVKPGGDG